MLIFRINVVLYNYFFLNLHRLRKILIEPLWNRKKTRLPLMEKLWLWI